jgi:hypothetical protein
MQVWVELLMKHNLFNLPLQSHTLDQDASRLTYELHGVSSFLRS